MNRPEPLLIRADASERIGTGHVMRMIALAQAYQDRGGSATIVCATCQEHIAERIRREKIDFEKLESDIPGSMADSNETIVRARSLGSKWVVLDGYHFGVDYQRKLREAGFRVMAMDDYGHCETWAADVVLNQNIYAPELNYHSEIESCRFLLGTRFALLRREFRVEAEIPRSLGSDDSKTADQPIRRLLVTLGGADPEDVTGRLLAALNSLSELRLEIKAVTGGGNPHLENLRQLASTSPHSIEVIQNVFDMPSLYRCAEGVISAGGSTCWEWLFFRLPAAVVCLAENQRRIIAALVKYRVATDLGWREDIEPERLPDVLRRWLDSSGDAIPQLSEEFAVDGLGADRVASLLDESNIWLRPAAAKDAETWFQWANDPAVRANGFHPGAIDWETHLKWFEHHRQSVASRLWIGFNIDQQPLGYVRLHRRDAGEWEIGVAVDPKQRNQGTGLRLVKLALLKTRVPSLIVARIKATNIPSIKLFESAGFALDSARTNSECCVYTIRRG